MVEPPPPRQHAPASWVDRWLPTAAKPYAMLARLDKPDAIWLYAWPCIWLITIASNKGEIPDIKMLALFGFGSIVLRGVACTVNDLLDRDIDKKVERTKTRPLASGALTPAQGFYFLVVQVLLWLAFLSQLNNNSFILGASWLALFFSYPLMKRLTYWPQAYLGFTLGWGVFLGSAAIKQSLDYPVLLPMYFAVICWTLVYDTIYAHQDRKDDLKAGVKSTAVTFGDTTEYWLSGFGAACIGSLALTGYNAHLAWPYYPFLAAAAGHIAWQISSVDLSKRSDCHRKFVSNKWFGGFIFGGILSGLLAP
ncbi:4-hydroxybenzoate polyprenyltransferase, mitochondrial-like [Miscanthus floridulus]|uniref:4-hydroxybenzoate polyprenyltransferase, mitochondrial-like n=1 Tax=Miscanthus floridulus TaxID=154761 RepID=UPI003458E9B1